MATGRSLEADMLQAIARYSPVEYLKLQSVLEDWRDTDIDHDNFSRARDNLVELGFILKPDYGSRFAHEITEAGWTHLGGETPLET